MRIPITKRLMTAAEMIGTADVLCDVGCDHGYLPIYLLSHQKIRYAYACDLRDGPLKTAASNIAAFHMKDFVQTVKSDGLAQLHDYSFDALSICGMGGRLIAEILKRDCDVAKRAKTIVLQPMSELHILREYLGENGFVILEERLALEDRRFYVLMKVSVGEETYRSGIDYIIGRKLYETPDSLNQLYLEKEISRYETILNARGGEENASEIAQILSELKAIRNRIFQ